MPRHSNYPELMQRFVAEYRASGETWPATARQIARWLIRTGRWDRSGESLVKMCARDVAEAMREEHYTDPQGRRVRTKHAAKFPAADGQTTLWDDIRTTERPFMERAFKGRRDQIVGDCVQLDVDVSSFNENSCPDDPIPMLFDFQDDVAEARSSTSGDEVGGDDVFEDPLTEKTLRVRELPLPNPETTAKPVEQTNIESKGRHRDGMKK